MSAPCTLLEWDSEFFGHRIGRVDRRRLAEADLPRIERWAAAECVECLYLLADADDPATVRAAEASGFGLMGLRVELDQRLPAAAGNPAPDPTIRPVQPGDREALTGIARASHEDTRFFADPRFSRDRAGALYARWVERSCFEAYSGAAFVAEIDGRAVGYIAVSIAEQRGVIDLLGVDAACRGHGLGRRLIQRGLDWCRTLGATEVTVVTQGRNIAAQRLYQQAGFRTSQVHLWYHRWTTQP